MRYTSSRYVIPRKAWGGEITSPQNYFDQNDKAMQRGQSVATLASSIPIVNLFKSIGETGSNIFAPKDEYGISNAGFAGQTIGGFLNPLESTSNLGNDLRSGKIGQFAADLFLPGIGAFMRNKEKKKQRDALIAEEKTKALIEKNKQEAIYKQGVYKSDYAYLSNLNLNDSQGLYMKKGGMIKPSHRGRFTAYKQRTGKTTSEALHSKDPHVRSMANFARMAKRGFKKLEMGGDLKPDQVFQKRQEYVDKINKPIPIKGGNFRLKDISGNKPGIRHGTIVNKSILNEISKAAAKEGVPLLDALATGMRESGLGHTYVTNSNYKTKGVVPKNIFQSWNSDTVTGIPLDYDQWRMKNNKVDKKYISKETSGYMIGMEEPKDVKLKYLGDYNKYLDTFKYDPSLKEPFRKEMRFLKANMGDKYNSKETDRNSKLAREKRVIMANPAMYHYADSVYNVYKKKMGKGGKIKASITNGISLGDGDKILTNSLGNTSGTHESGQNIPIRKNGKILAYGEPGEVLVNDPNMPNTPFVLSKRIGRNGMSFADEFLALEGTGNKKEQAKIINMNNRMASKRTMRADGGINLLDAYTRAKNNIDIRNRFSDPMFTDPIMLETFKGNSPIKKKGVAKSINSRSKYSFIGNTSFKPKSNWASTKSLDVYNTPNAGLQSSTIPSVTATSNYGFDYNARKFMGKTSNFLKENANSIIGAAGTINNMIMSNNALNRQKTLINNSLQSTLAYEPKYAKNYLLDTNVDVNDQISATNQGYNSSISKLDLLDPSLASALKNIANISRVGALNSIYGERNRMSTGIRNQNTSNIQQISNANTELSNQTALMKLNARISANEQLGNAEAARLGNIQGGISEFNTILRDRDILKSLDKRWEDSIGTGYRAIGGKVNTMNYIMQHPIKQINKELNKKPILGKKRIDINTITYKRGGRLSRIKRAA